MNSASIRSFLLVPVLCFACKPGADESKPACDTEQLRATTTKLAQLPPSERGRAAWDGLKSACPLPQAIVAHYDTEDPRKLSRLYNPAQENRELEPLIREACRDWDTLRAVMQDTLPLPEQRALASFNACQAERYEVIPSHQVSGFTSTEVTWAVHQWLLDHGVERDLAMPITLGILAYELELGSPVREQPGLVLPAAVGLPLVDGRAVYVEPQDNGESVASEMAAALSTGSRVLVTADAKVPFATMLDLLDDAGEAGRLTLDLVVSSPEQGITILALKTPPRPESRYFPAMTVEITADGKCSGRSAADVESTPIACGSPDAVWLFAKDVKRKFPRAETVIISADPKVPLQQVVDVIAAVQGTLPFALFSRTAAHQHHLAGLDESGNLIGADELAVDAVSLMEAVKQHKLEGTTVEVPSKVEHGKPEVSGGLDSDIIFRIVRAHIKEVQRCHEEGLSKNPSLAGSVSINFVITGEGKVASAAVEENTLDNVVVASCIAKAVKRWIFPKPKGGGNVIVTYPFELSVE
jgi:biopolymer transport protein ExbD